MPPKPDRQCDVCRLKGCKVGPLLPKRGPCDVLIVTEGPGLANVRAGELDAYGADAQVIDRLRTKFPKVRFGRSFATACVSDNKREKVLAKRRNAPTPLAACNPGLRRDIEAAKPKVIVALGEWAHKAAAQALGVKIGKGETGRRFGDLLAQHGHPEHITSEVSGLGHDLYYVCSFSGFDVTRRWPMMTPVLFDDLARAVLIATRGYAYAFEVQRERIVWPKTVDEANDLLGALESALDRDPSLRFVVDIETPKGQMHALKPHCIGIEGAGLPVVFPIKNEGRAYWKNRATPAEFKVLKARVRALLSKRPIVAHNAMFDSTILENSGWIDRGCKVIDTAIMYRNTREGTGPRKSLAFLSSRASNNRLWKLDADETEAFHTSNEAEWIYNGEDLIETRAAFVWLKRKIQVDGMQNSARIDHEAFPIFRAMGQRGLHVSVPRLEEAREQVSAVLAERTKEIEAVAGRKVNPNSGNDLRRLLFGDRGLRPVYDTAGGLLGEDGSSDDAAVNAPSLIAMQEKGLGPVDAALIDSIIGWKTAAKLISGFISPLLDGSHKNVEVISDPLRRILHTSWVLFGPPSGRAASKPNVQNLPKVALANVRRCFIPPPGYVLISADFEQIEARLFAVIAEDEVMFKAFKDGLDVHALNFAHLDAKPNQVWERYAEIVRMKKHGTELEQEDATVARLVAKIWCFSMFYGAGIETGFRQMVSFRNKISGKRLFAGLRKADAERWYSAFHDSHPNAKPWARGCVRHAERKGWIDEPYHGRKRWFDGGVVNPNEPPNHRIQGAASGMALDALMKVEAWFAALPDRRPEEGPVNFVHDELVCVIRAELAEECRLAVQTAMTRDWRGLTFGAEAEIQSAWTETID